MSDDPLRRLKYKLDAMRQERDKLNAFVLEERSSTSRMESEYLMLQSEYNRARSSLEQKEQRLDRYNSTIGESETAMNKLLTNSEKLFCALEQESASIQKLFNSRY